MKARRNAPADPVAHSIYRDRPVYTVVPADEAVLYDEDDSQANWYAWAVYSPRPWRAGGRAQKRGER